MLHMIFTNLLPEQGHHKDIHSKGEEMKTATQGHPFLVGVFYIDEQWWGGAVPGAEILPLHASWSRFN